MADHEQGPEYKVFVGGISWQMDDQQLLKGRGSCNSAWCCPLAALRASMHMSAFCETKHAGVSPPLLPWHTVSCMHTEMVDMQHG